MLLASIPSASAQQGGNNQGSGSGPANSAPKNTQKGTDAPAVGSLIGPCSSKLPTQRFFVDFNGNVSDTGRTYEGPLCIEVFFNPIQQFVGLQTSTSTAPGPDLSKVVLGGPSAQGEKKLAPPPTAVENLPQAVQDLKTKADKLTGQLSQLKVNYATAMQRQDQAIADISLLRKTTQFLSGDQAVMGVRNGYVGLQDDLRSALNVADFVPSDRVSDKVPEPLLSIAQDLQDRLNRLPLDFANGTETNFDCMPSNPPLRGQVSWSTWFAKCKDSVYTPLKTIIDANLQTANSFTSGSDNTKALRTKVAIAQYWNSLFATLGLTTDLPKPTINAKDISPLFYAHRDLRCGILFNQTSNTTVNIVAADLGPTLSGNDPTIKAQSAFTTVSCGTPFAVSAGVGFNTIEQKQFAIIQSSDGKGGTTNTFGTTSDSKITPVALVVLHVRLAEWNRHKYAFYGSLGVGGSLQNQSNASPVQFLPGVSVSFWRTMYITVGPNIGNKTSLAGGFKEGDTVPAGITSINGLTSTSHAVGFGFAITFTKP